MSATNRGAQRNKDDFYATPIECINTIMNYLPTLAPGSFVLEPSAGNGNFLKVLRERYGRHIIIEAIELREEEKQNLELLADNVTIGDFLNIDTEYIEYDLIIGNPPFCLAREFVDKCLELLAPGGKLVLLLRTAFLESKKRFKWWQDKLPNGLYTLHDRPSFTGKGTDATSYSFFVWENTPDDKQIIKVI